MKKGFVALAFVTASFGADTLTHLSSLDSLAAPRAKYLQIFQSRVETAKLELEKYRRALVSRELDLKAGLDANAKIPGAVSEYVINEWRYLVNIAKAEITAGESKVKEAENLASLVEQALPLGIEIPISFQFQP